MDVEDASRNTSLHLIVQSGNQALLKVVAEFEPDYKVANSLGDTPLHVAIQKSDSKMARLLITLGGEELMTIKNKSGLIPAACSTDQRTKMELSGASAVGSMAGGSSIGQGSMLKKFQHSQQQRSITPGYKQALNSVLKGEKLD